ncbi:hypothetical protein [Microbacterium sp. LWH12-1.2]|uniref:hypothetical protein n=1 Tax=Microbacterium sp. LWH12-1.2 TaxID=3135259 RepID=UPI003421CB9B
MRAVEGPNRTALRVVRFVLVAAGSLLLFRWQWLACASAYNEAYEEGQRMPGSMDGFGFVFGVVPVIALSVVVVAAFTWTLFGRVESFRSGVWAILIGVLRAAALALLVTALTCGAAFLFVEAELGGQIFDPVSYREAYVP